MDYSWSAKVTLLLGTTFSRLCIRYNFIFSNLDLRTLSPSTPIRFLRSMFRLNNIHFGLQINEENL